MLNMSGNLTMVSFLHVSNIYCVIPSTRNSYLTVWFSEMKANLERDS